MFWITVAVFVGVAALVVGVSMFFNDRQETKVEDRLDVLAGMKKGGGGKKKKDESVIRQGALDELKESGLFEGLTSKFGDLPFIFEQANVSLSAGQFFAICAAMAGVAGAAVWFSGTSWYAIVPAMLAAGLLPVFWLTFRRKRRLKKFAAQLPDALELIARALRAGHSLGAGMNLVADEMPAPIGVEFSRAFEEQNLGIPLEDSLKNLTLRVPNLDLKFFATAVVLQRQTGGDLAEILDKIGHLIRERFKIWGQVQALTGEGRLSGIVLLALPPILFLVVYYLNPNYSMMLFTEPMGQQMLIGAIIMQVIGALVIRKIVNIKV